MCLGRTSVNDMGALPSFCPAIKHHKPQAPVSANPACSDGNLSCLRQPIQRAAMAASVACVSKPSVLRWQPQAPAMANPACSDGNLRRLRRHPLLRARTRALLYNMYRRHFFRGKAEKSVGMFWWFPKVLYLCSRKREVTASSETVKARMRFSGEPHTKHVL